MPVRKMSIRFLDGFWKPVRAGYPRQLWTEVRMNLLPRCGLDLEVKVSDRDGMALEKSKYFF